MALPLVEQLGIQFPLKYSLVGVRRVEQLPVDSV